MIEVSSLDAAQAEGYREERGIEATCSIYTYGDALILHSEELG
jgi:hypothetical protein